MKSPHQHFTGINLPGGGAPNEDSPPLHGAAGLCKSYAITAGDGNGALYVTDASAVRRIAPDGQVTTVARIAGAALAAVAADGNGNGRLYVADEAANAIRRIADDGTASMVVQGVGPNGTTPPIGLAMLAPDALAVLTRSSVYRLALP